MLVVAGALATACTSRGNRSEPHAVGLAANASAALQTESGLSRNSGSSGDAGDGTVVKAPLPDAVHQSILGCWQLEDRERWTITRTEQGGARVVRTILARGDKTAGLDYARRAAMPADIMYDPAKGTLAFSTAGHIHALLFVFTAGPQGLEGSWASSHAPGEEYHWTAGRVALRRCGSDGGG